MTGRGNDIPDQSHRFFIRKNEGPILMQNPSSMSFVLIQGQQYVLPVSNQLVGSFVQVPSTVNQTSVSHSQPRTSIEHDSKHEQTDDSQELPPALDKVDDDEELDENRETPMGFPCEKAFLREADEFKKSVNDDGVVLHNIHGFAIEESERPLSPMSVYLGKRKEKDSKEVIFKKSEESLKKEKKRVGYYYETSNTIPQHVARNSSQSLLDCNSYSDDTAKLEKRKKCRGNELTQLLSMDFGPKAGKRIILDNKRRSFNEKFDDVKKRSILRHRNFSEDSVSYNSSSKECSELDYPVTRISPAREESPILDLQLNTERALPGKDSASQVFGTKNLSETGIESIADPKADKLCEEDNYRIFSTPLLSGDEIKAECADEPSSVGIHDISMNEYSGRIAEEEIEKEEASDIIHGDNIGLDELTRRQKSLPVDSIRPTEKLELFQQWESKDGVENITTSDIWKVDFKPKLSVNYRIEPIPSKDQLFFKTEKLTPNQNRCLNCMGEECSEIYPQYCSIACRQSFIRENGDNYSLTVSMSSDYEECSFRRNREAELLGNIKELLEDYSGERETAQDELDELYKTAHVNEEQEQNNTDNLKIDGSMDSINPVCVANSISSGFVDTEANDDEDESHNSRMEELNKVHPYNWTVEETRTWILSVTGSRELAETFEKEKIDASVLFSLSSKEMRESPFRMKFGFARKIEVAIDKCCAYWRILNRLDNHEDPLLSKDLSSITVDDLYRMVFQRTKDKKLASRVKDEEIDGFILGITTWEELKATCVTEDLTKLGVKWKVDRVEHLFNALKTKCVK